MNIWMAMLFMAIGIGISEFYNFQAWSRYYAGRRDKTIDERREKNGEKSSGV